MRFRLLFTAPTLRACALMLAFLASGRMAFAIVRPDAAEARAFASVLAGDFAMRNTDAILSRIDGEALLDRVIPARTDEARKINAEIWEARMKPVVRQALAVLAGYRAMVLGRVILDDDARQLECLFVKPDGGAQFLLLRLDQSTRGGVHIVDLQIGGQTLAFTRVLRHQFILERLVEADARDEEERYLRDRGQGHELSTRLGITAFSDGKFDVAWSNWQRLAADLRTTRIWRNVRDSLALQGCKPAWDDLRDDIAHGAAVDPFVRLYVANETKDKAAALAAVDAILATHQQLAIYRCTKARLLEETGRPMEGYELCRDVVELTPRTATAYVIGVEAAAAANRNDLAVEMLQRWAIFAAPSEIDQTLADIPSVGKLRAAPAYHEWLEAKRQTAKAKSP